MRKELQKINGVRHRFVATFVRYGSKTAYKGPPVKTLLFQDVKDKHGTVYTDHLWFTNTKGWERLNLQPGDKICFDARVRQYTKGYRGYRDDEDMPRVSTDYKLSHPNNIIKHVAGEQNLLF